MKQLLLARHGKPSWAKNSLDDWDRPLKINGLKETYRMAEWLQNQKVSVDLIITSPAIRAVHTALIYAQTLKYPSHRIEINDLLYNGDKGKLIKFLQNSDVRYDSILLVGHDPGLTNLYNHLTKESIDKIPSSGIAGVKLKVKSFGNLKKNSCKSNFLMGPKKLPKKS